MFKKSILIISAVAFLMQSNPVFAAPRDHRESRRNFHKEIVVHRPPPRYAPPSEWMMALFYWRGLFYRFTSVGYVVVPPPAGVVMPVMPPNYAPVIAYETPYYY